VQHQRISAGHAHLQVGIDLPRSEPAVKKTSGFFGGCKPLMVAYIQRIVPNNNPVLPFVFPAGAAPEKLRLQRPFDGHKLAK
jgi:hypothetical protein